MAIHSLLGVGHFPSNYHYQLPSYTAQEMRVEAVAKNQFCAVQGVIDGVNTGGSVTGCVGYAILGSIVMIGSIDTDEDDSRERIDREMQAAHLAGKIGYWITSIPGAIAGLAVSPLRIAYLCATRPLVYTSKQVEHVCSVLELLKLNLESSEARTEEYFKNVLYQILQKYGKTHFSTSRSSHELMQKIAQDFNFEEGSFNLEATNFSERAGALIAYLSDERTLSIGATIKHRTNQGKKLFEIIMSSFAGTMAL
jgi:hypothetical protein